MFLKQWWRIRQYRLGRAMLQREGLWGITPATIEFLTEHIRIADLEKIAVGTLRVTEIEVVTVCVDELLHRLKTITEWIHTGQPIPATATVTRPRTASTLEQYLTTTDGRALSMAKLYPVLLEVTRAFVVNLQLVASEDDPLEQHYYRRCAPFIADLHTVLLALWYNCKVVTASDDFLP